MSLSLFGQFYLTHVCTKLTECIWACLSSCILYNENSSYTLKSHRIRAGSEDHDRTRKVSESIFSFGGGKITHM